MGGWRRNTADPPLPGRDVHVSGTECIQLQPSGRGRLSRRHHADRPCALLRFLLQRIERGSHRFRSSGRTPGCVKFMKSRSRDLLSCTLRSPDSVTRFSMGEWDLLVRQARSAGLLARVRHVLAQHQLTEAIPAVARLLFYAASTLAAKQQLAVRWEVDKIRTALKGLAFPFMLLKGSAYVMANLPAASGRLFNDIDILVPRAQLGAGEAALMLAGWHPTLLSDYDQRYYRRWMHEIPPLQHAVRATVIDVHHAILPDTARYHPDSATLRHRANTETNKPNNQEQTTEDRILHSATHVFHDGELPHGLRDLTDLDLLRRDAAANSDFWLRLTARAIELQLGRARGGARRERRGGRD